MKEFLIILLAILILFRVFRRYIFFSVIKAVNDQAMKAAQHSAGQQSRRPDGTVTIDSIPNQKKDTDSSGEYVDYEEVK